MTNAELWLISIGFRINPYEPDGFAKLLEDYAKHLIEGHVITCECLDCGATVERELHLDKHGIDDWRKI